MRLLSIAQKVSSLFRGFPRYALNDDWAIDIAATQVEQWLAAAAARVPSTNKHIPFISTHPQVVVRQIDA